MRLLTFMQMAETRKEMDFALIQEELVLGPQAVEEFVIDVLKTKAVSAKLDQIQKKVIVRSTTHRTFGKHHWQQIRGHLMRMASCGAVMLGPQDGPTDRPFKFFISHNPERQA
nr:hypothetical protein BaRGS_002145 [Batillaria attramentaria]